MTLPSYSQPDVSWPHFQAYQRVIEAIYAIPAHFNSRTVIEGIPATDLQTLNTVLGAAIEDQVVSTLNQMRSVWDPGEGYQTYFFQRQAQVFPDVLFKSDRNGQDIVLGIELKGWYLLAKERVPNFRFTTTLKACADADLVVVVPWALSNVLSGSPTVYRPYVTPAKYAAAYRNYWWTEIRNSRGEKGIVVPSSVGPYPSKSNQVADRPRSDGGGNFGRLARSGMMDQFIEETLNLPLAGIPAGDWVDFLRQFGQ